MTSEIIKALMAELCSPSVLAGFYFVVVRFGFLVVCSVSTWVSLSSAPTLCLFKPLPFPPLCQFVFGTLIGMMLCCFCLHLVFCFHVPGTP